MSCSDKLALWNSIGFQGALLARLCGPLYFSSLVIGDGYLKQSLQRAINDRVAGSFLKIGPTKECFKYSREQVGHGNNTCSKSLCWITATNTTVTDDSGKVDKTVEVYANGRILGVTKRNFHKT